VAYYYFEGRWQGWIRDPKDTDDSEDESDESNESSSLALEDARFTCMDELLKSKR
jgi:hypothetical protein